MKKILLTPCIIAVIGVFSVLNAQKSASNSNSSPILSKENTVLLLVDEQVGLLSGVRDISTAELTHNVVGLVKAAKVLGIPIILTQVDAGGLWGPVLPEILAVIPDAKIIKRSTINAWDDLRIPAAIAATGRKQILIAGISLEVCASLPAISAKLAGYDPRVVLDASGTFNQAKREAGIQRLTTLGIPLTDYGTAAVELLKDNADPLAGAVYNAIDLNFATIVWQLNQAAKQNK